MLAPAFAGAAYLAGCLVFFRAQIFSGFDIAFGDRGDARLAIFLHEHVFRALLFRAPLLSPPFFYDQTKTLGYTDAYLLDQLIYAPARLAGAAPLTALSIVVIGLSAVCFACMWLFLRRLGASAATACVAALICTFANNLYFKSGQPQHFTVYYIPIVVCCAELAVSGIHSRRFRSYIFAACAAGLFGLMFSTGYYMTWFFAVALMICLPIGAVYGRADVSIWWRKNPRQVLGLAATAVLSLAAALSLFAVIYGPVLATGAARNFSEYLYYAASPIDIINVGRDNLVWSAAIRSLHLVPGSHLGNGESSIAVTPTVTLLLLLSGAAALNRRFWRPGASSMPRILTIGGLAVGAAFYVLTVKIGEFSLFHLLYAVLPGAQAIRAGFRCMVVANFFAAVAIALACDRMFAVLRQEPRIARRFALSAMLGIALCLAVIEQVNLAAPTALSATFERRHLAAVGAPPRECRTFYIAPQPNTKPADFQIDAMMVALQRNLPTINGYSGLSPAGWDFINPDAPDYEERAIHWAFSRKLAEGLCRLDITSGAWSRTALDRDLACNAGRCLQLIRFGASHEFAIDLRTGGNGGLFADEQWWGPEPSGRWTAARQAALMFSVGRPRDLDVSISMGGLLSPKASEQSAWLDANGCRIGAYKFDLAANSSPRTVRASIPAACIDADGTIILRISTDRVRRPKDIEDTDDNRLLGVGIERIVLRE